MSAFIGHFVFQFGIFSSEDNLSIFFHFLYLFYSVQKIICGTLVFPPFPVDLYVIFPGISPFIILVYFLPARSSFEEYGQTVAGVLILVNFCGKICWNLQ